MTSLVENLLPSVHDIPSLRESLSKLAQCERDLKVKGALSILDNFNIIYSFLQNVKELKVETIEEIINMLIKVLINLESDLKKILAEKVSNEQRVQYLKLLKIVFYLTIEFTNYLEKKHQTNKDNDLFAGAIKKIGKKPAPKKPFINAEILSTNASGEMDWSSMREKVLDGLSKILLLNIQKLWDPPIAEEQFVVIVTNLCYKMLENCHNSSLRSGQQRKILKDYLCHILGIMIKRFNHSYGACVMIMQTLPLSEHLSAVYADLVQACVLQLGYDSILPDILREFRHANAGLNNNNKDKENPNLKFYSQFLIELGERLASQLLNYLSLVQEFLDDESYLMRNAVIYIYGEIIIKVLNPDAVSKDIKLKEARNELLDTLIEHMYDVHATTRSKTLQVWKKICDEKAIPLQYMNEVMKRCVGRMEDVASGVRKNAFQLLCDLIRNNPYGIVSIEMSMSKIEAEFRKEDANLKKLVKESGFVEADDTGKSQEEQVEAEEWREKQKQGIIVQQAKVNYLKDMLEFVKQIESAIPKISRLLFSKTQTDVFEVISFFVTCYEHGLVDMLFGIRKMLSLVLFAEKNIKDAVVGAYKRLYLSAGRDECVQTAKKLLRLVQDVSLCERDALTEMIGEFAANDELDSGLVNVLWEIFATASKRDKLNALILLGMIIKRVPEKGEANVDVLIEFGLATHDSDGEGETNDLDLIIHAETCLALSYISPDSSTKTLTQQDLNVKKKKPADSIRFNFSNEPFKLLNSHPLFERIVEISVRELPNTSNFYWTKMIENMIHCVFKLADCPISVMEEMTVKMLDKLKPLKALRLPPVPLFSEEPQKQDDATSLIVNSDHLARFFNFVGDLATKTLVFLNQSFVCELKRRKMCKENMKGENFGSKTKSKTSRRKSKSRKSLAAINQTSTDSALEEEMGLQGAEAEDVEQMLVESLIDQKLVQSVQGINNSLFERCLCLIVDILKEPRSFTDEALQLSSTMALVKIMLLSPRICNQYLQLLFTLMEKSPDAIVRSQIIIGIGDLVFRFPNALEPWTDHLYLPLRDISSSVVRINTIRVLSHLILKEMIKTRGRIYEIALCTIDPDEKIASLCKAFFQELALRNNGLVIYNAMPDIISQLSGGEGKDGSRVISEESFRTVVSYLFSFIKRDKQCETLIEKLCTGFRQASASERKCRDLAFCLSKIQLSDSGIKKLKETFKFYADKMCIPAVHETFKNVILKNARKVSTLKNETRMLIDELEKMIDDVRQKGVNGEENENEANLNESCDSDLNTDSVVPQRCFTTQGKPSKPNTNKTIEKKFKGKSAKKGGGKMAKKNFSFSSSDDATNDSSSDLSD